jgi:hypothetical protein
MKRNTLGVTLLKGLSLDISSIRYCQQYCCQGHKDPLGHRERYERSDFRARSKRLNIHKVNLVFPCLAGLLGI